MVIDYWKEHPEMDKNGDGKLQLVYLMGDRDIQHPSRDVIISRARSKMQELRLTFLQKIQECG